MATAPISSVSNPRIKNVVRLSTNRRHREREQRTIVEGSREVRRCLDAGVVPAEVYICPELTAAEDQDVAHRLATQFAIRNSHYATVTPDVFAKIAVRGDSGGLLLVIPYTQTALNDLPLSANPFLVVVEGAEKPGNVGAILRTADAAGVDGLILCAGGTDLHNPNVIRASLGTRFTVPVAEAPTGAVIAWLKARGIASVAATPDATAIYTATDLTGPLAIVTGSEAEGLGAEWLAAADATVTIPMYGVADSLNLATSTALLLYEVVRQRGVGR
ncbi:MAG: RNA methyltransferase [Caldilineaceae bacterium]|nr:RNA methyltransferase [Caldilineaceae bacterium]HRJ40462.1 RNA methyltransferase [Caldilineaceae bacterium]